jgi:hypothetical protein
MSDLQHLQERLRHAAGPDERFSITIGEEFVRDGMGGHRGKRPAVLIMRWRFQSLHEVGTGQGIATGGTVEAAMERFETWLAANPDRNNPERDALAS